MKIQAIVLTAGAGTRMKSRTPKPFILVKGKPLFIYSLEVLQKSPLVDGIVVACANASSSKIKSLLKKFSIKKISDVVIGGERRCDSVANGLAVIDHDTDFVMVHDGARPFILAKMIKGLADICQKEKAAIVAVPVKSTIKKVDPVSMTVIQTLERAALWEAQTPQMFRKDILVKAHAQDKLDNPTDDAVLVERLGVKVGVFHGDYHNIKITTPEDIKLMEVFLGARIK